MSSHLIFSNRFQQILVFVLWVDPKRIKTALVNESKQTQVFLFVSSFAADLAMPSFCFFALDFLKFLTLVY